MEEYNGFSGKQRDRARAWREYRANVEAGGRKKIGASKLQLNGRDQFDWGEPPRRRALLEIELSQDAIAAASAAPKASNVFDATEREQRDDQPADPDKAHRVVASFTSHPLTEHEREVVRVLLDNPGLSPRALTQKSGWRGQSWRPHFGRLCRRRGHLLWPAPYEKSRSADFYCAVLADFDPETRGFTMKPEAVEGFRQIGLTPRAMA